MTRFKSLLHLSRAISSKGNSSRRQRGAPIEALESRELLTVGLSGIALLGTVKSVSAVVLTFSGPLDPTTAQEVTSYAFGKPDAQPAPGASFTIGDLFPFFATRREAMAKQKLVVRGKIQFASAVYDASADTVTLTPYAPFQATAFFKFLRVRGSGANALRDATGLPIAGGVDEVFRWKLRQGKTIRYADAYNDHIELKLSGIGRLYVFMRRGNNEDPLIFVDGATATTTVTGSVQFSEQAIGPVNVEEVEGAAGTVTNLFTDSDFHIQTNVP